MLLAGGKAITPDGIMKKDIAIENGRVFALMDQGTAGDAAFTDAGRTTDSMRNIDIYDRVIRCDNFFIAPGFIDVHVHLREPGFAYKETIRTGTLAAARGGYTAVCSMPNLDPAPVDRKTLDIQRKIIDRDAVIRVLPYGAITADQSGRGALSDMQAMSGSVAAFSDDGKGVQEEQLMEAAMQEAGKLGKIVAAHCEDEAFPAGSHESEWKQAARDISIALRTGCPYHICHISCRETVQLARAAKCAGLDVTCETAPHYLVLSDQDVKDDGRYKMNPPLKSAGDRDELIAALLDGTVDMIATDHAPHSAAEKEGGFAESAFGITGLETAFPVLYTKLVRTGVLELEKLITLMSTAPARRFGIPGGEIKEGGPADLTVLDLDSEYLIDPGKFASRGKSTPFAGMKVRGQTVMTVHNGKIVYERI